MNLIKKISIGTAQFGMNYGERNKKALSFTKIRKILTYARSIGIQNIDTAFNYGRAEEKLGIVGVKNWKISTKFSKIPSNENPVYWIEKHLKKSLKRLKIKKINTLFIHDFNSINKNEKKAEDIMKFLKYLKKIKLIKNIGISIYDPKILNRIIDLKSIDVLQAPANIFDRRIFQNKNVEILKDNNISLEIRSIFLQGLILEKLNNIPKKLNDYLIYFKKIEKLSNKMNTTKISIALSVLNNQRFDKLIIGFNDENELKEIVENIPLKTKNLKPFFIKKKNFLINPYLWNTK
ncbi:aldo/keto reductase [Pelagibacterales bacterium SAG-MED38]|nr:aldo/keto reductase [Pelagibacterales bacterium SAG-MED38]